MKNEKPREFWIRVGVHSLPAVFDSEPHHITSHAKYRFTGKPKHQGEVVHVIEHSAFIKAVEALKKILFEEDPYSPDYDYKERTMAEIARKTLKELGE